MTELELFKFIKDNEVDMRWDNDVLSTWLPPNSISEFSKMAESLLSDGGNEARITAMGYVWIDLLPICDYYGIEPENIQPK